AKEEAIEIARGMSSWSIGKPNCTPWRWRTANMAHECPASATTLLNCFQNILTHYLTTESDRVARKSADFSTSLLESLGIMFRAHTETKFQLLGLFETITRTAVLMVCHSVVGCKGVRYVHIPQDNGRLVLSNTLVDNCRHALWDVVREKRGS